MVKSSYLCDLAARDFPRLKYDDLMICIDYREHPPIYKLKPLDDYRLEWMEKRKGKIITRHLAIVDRVMENRSTYRLIESLFSFGQNADCVLTQAANSVWPTGGEFIEGILKLMLDMEDQDGGD